MSADTPDPKSNFETLLLKEYDFLSASFQNNEELGERRVGIYLTMVGIAVTVAGYLILKPENGGSVVYLPAVFPVLFALLLFGILTLTRVVRRNCVTDECIRGLQKVRRYFITERANQPEHFVFDPYKDKDPREWKRMWSLGKGGMVETVVLLNSIVSFALVATLCYWAWSTMPAPDNRHAGWLALALGLWDAGLAWVLQVVRVRRLYARDLEKRLADKRLTKDGKTVIPGTQ